MATVTTQLTSKSLKAQKAIGLIIAIIAFICVYGSEEKQLIHFCAFALGSICYVQARIRIWWNHS